MDAMGGIAGNYHLDTTIHVIVSANSCNVASALMNSITRTGFASYLQLI